MSKKQPIIKHTLVGGREMFEVFSPDGQQAATFYNEHFLRRMMEEMFDLSPFNPLPLSCATQSGITGHMCRREPNHTGRCTTSGTETLGEHLSKSRFAKAA